MDDALELGEFDSYEAYLADLGVSLRLPCLFLPLESSVALIYYAFLEISRPFSWWTFFPVNDSFLWFCFWISWSGVAAPPELLLLSMRIVSISAER